MSRKTRNSTSNDLYELFMVLPVWVPFILALVLVGASYCGLNPIVRLFLRLGSIVIVVNGMRAAYGKWRRVRLAATVRTLDRLRSMSWREFELVVGQAYRQEGWTVTEAGGGGPDGGIDLVLRRSGEKCLVQCKQWRTSTVGVKVVREMYGVMLHEKADAVKIVCCGKFAPDAIDFAKGKPIELVDGDRLMRMLSPISNNVSPSIERETIDAERACPKCGSPMTLRTAKRGANAGSSFYGCTRYPNCRGIVPAVDG